MSKKKGSTVPKRKPSKEAPVDLMTLALEEIKRVEIRVDENSIRIDALEELLRRRKLYQENSQ